MTSSTQRRPAVFLDRDGTLIEDVDYLSSPEQIAVFDRSGDALRLLKECGYVLILISNQSGVGRGIFDEPTLKLINDTMIEKLGGLIDAVYYCPHRPEDNCRCRKPRPGMLLEAAARFDLQLADSLLLGDTPSDLQAAKAAGIGRASLFEGGRLPAFDALFD